MRFDELVRKINPKVKGIAYRLDGKYTSFSEDDLYQQALMRLWQKYNNGELEDKTESYVVQGCSFEMRNYIRTHFKGTDRRAVSTDITINDSGDRLINFIADEQSISQRVSCNTSMTVKKIERRLSSRQKSVLKMSRKGFTVREIGRRLGVSHVMVVKIKKHIAKICNDLELFS